MNAQSESLERAMAELKALARKLVLKQQPRKHVMDRVAQLCTGFGPSTVQALDLLFNASLREQRRLARQLVRAARRGAT
jgi:hypothetical protein